MTRALCWTSVPSCTGSWPLWAWTNSTGAPCTARTDDSRVLASWIYSRTDDDGQPVYGGIRYESRLGRQWECWAIFDGALLTTSTVTPIDSRNPALMAIADQYGLTPH